MRKYEAVLIVDPQLEDSAIQEAVERFTKVLEGRGEVSKLDQWGRRRLAYPINHRTDGHYVVASFKAEPEVISELDRLLDIGEEYIRHKIVRVPE